MTLAARPARMLALAACTTFAALSTGACATKKFVNRQVESERIARAAADSATGRDVAGLRADQTTLRTDLNALRTDLTALRTEYGARITAMENSVKFALPVHFAYDDASVRAEDQAALERFAGVVQKYYGGAQVTVEGFADPAGTPRYNLALSRRRADAVREFLVTKGMGDGQLKSVGYGETRLVRPGASRDAQGAELNRRVVFVVETAGAGEATTAALSMP